MAQLIQASKRAVEEAVSKGGEAIETMASEIKSNNPELIVSTLDDIKKAIRDAVEENANAVVKEDRVMPSKL